MTVVDAPKDWTITNSNPHELTTELFPVVTSWLSISAASSAVDLIIEIDSVGLAIAS